MANKGTYYAKARMLTNKGKLLGAERTAASFHAVTCGQKQQRISFLSRTVPSRCNYCFVNLAGIPRQSQDRRVAYTVVGGFFATIGGGNSVAYSPKPGIVTIFPGILIE